MRLIGGRRVIKATSVVAAAVLITGAGNSLAARAATTSGSRPTSPNHPATKQTQTPKVEATAPGHGGVDVSWHHSPKNARAFTVSRTANGVTENLTPKPVHGHSFRDRTAKPGTAYTYTVKVADVQPAGRTATGSVQQNATWRCRWNVTDAKKPRLEAIEVTDYEEVVATLPSKTLFSDCTEAALAKEPCFAAQLKHGQNYWVEQIDHSYRNGLVERYGLAEER